LGSLGLAHRQALAAELELTLLGFMSAGGLYRLGRGLALCEMSLPVKRRRDEMKIAQVAPLAEAVPPKLYGGTERIVSWLTEALVADGHDVTLFASGDSQTSARLVACSPRGLRLTGIRDHTSFQLSMLDRVLQREKDFDIIHFHVDQHQFAMFRGLEHKCLTTLHGRLDLPDIVPLFESFPMMPLVSISNNQRRPLKSPVDWLSTVSHGLPASVCPFSEKGGDYLAFLGRISPEKRPDRAIEIAKRAGVPLKIAAKVDQADRDYYETEIKHLLDHPLIEYVGEIDERQKCAFLGGARALLFPIDWPEPFGIVMIEAMSAGTPVVAWRRGSVPEVVKEGVSGCMVDSIEAATEAVGRTATMSRHAVRAEFEARFTASRMAAAYVEAYNRLMQRRPVKLSLVAAE
jgi:glycosyltransferase involved in cell wall biosynthesis